MKIFRFTPLIFLLLDACIDPMQVPLESSGSLMVVDGMITNEPGPYTVKLFYSSNLENSSRLPEPISNAKVSIINSLNETETLNETSSGVYESTVGGMQGVVGLSYYLKIVTAKGEYQSAPQVMMPAGNLDNLYFEFSPEEIVTNTRLVDAFNLFVDSHGAASDPNLYRWRWTGVYKVKTYPELYTKGDPPYPAPWPCSGYINYGGSLTRIADCTCCICWVTAYSSTSNVSDSRFTNGYEFKKILVGSIPITARHFYERYHVEVEQLSVSEEVHNFWDLVAKQQAARGSLFQPNAVRVNGNVKNVDNPKERALGVFSVSAISKKAIFLEPKDIPYTVPAIDQLPYPCLDVFGNATMDKPGFW
ncbi:MAG TPA: DUF4249 domain-containing protein [Cyclobacteriaceae bacterium]|nr:DUF4249 domain-containing protein [Cyclobacteriaceae bacterium]